MILRTDKVKVRLPGLLGCLGNLLAGWSDGRSASLAPNGDQRVKVGMITVIESSDGRRPVPNKHGADIAQRCVQRAGYTMHRIVPLQKRRKLVVGYASSEACG